MIATNVAYSFATKTAENVSSLLRTASVHELRRSLLTSVDLTDRKGKPDLLGRPVLQCYKGTADFGPM